MGMVLHTVNLMSSGLINFNVKLLYKESMYKEISIILALFLTGCAPLPQSLFIAEELIEQAEIDYSLYEQMKKDAKVSSSVPSLKH